MLLTFVASSSPIAATYPEELSMSDLAAARVMIAVPDMLLVLTLSKRLFRVAVGAVRLNFRILQNLSLQ